MQLVDLTRPLDPNDADLLPAVYFVGLTAAPARVVAFVD